MLFLSVATSFTGALEEQQADTPLPDAKTSDRCELFLKLQLSSLFVAVTLVICSCSAKIL